MNRTVNCKIILIVFYGFTSLLVEANFAPRPCKKNEWACNDGTCIDASQKCNGAVSCPDGSDETFLLCRNEPCKGLRKFKCVYGGCVPRYATCDGVKDCADNSDELILQCRNEATYLECSNNITLGTAVENAAKWDRCKLLWRTCNDGEVLDNFQKCDGSLDCSDGSDETLETCATDQRDCHPFLRFRCEYGACVAKDKVCNGVIDCWDGSDELYDLCYPKNENKKEWTCDDGTSIKDTKKCDGTADCPDASDETFIHCRNNACPNKFRCVYGGCVGNSAICNGVQDCVDGSDEKLLQCRNELTQTQCFDSLQYEYMSDTQMIDIKYSECGGKDTKCTNGQHILRSQYICDGKVHCEDGSDESMEICATDRYNCLLNGRFRCQYGGCIDKSKVCDKVNDCADGSDELERICNIPKCVLPTYPANGGYIVRDEPGASPGHDLSSARLLYFCHKGYELNEPDPVVNCVNGTWENEPLICIIQCHLKKDPSIVYWCPNKDPMAYTRTQECGNFVPDGTIVTPQCREPNYHYTTGVLENIRCLNGHWDLRVPICSPKCGLVTPEGTPLIVNGTLAERGELPWHAAIYKKQENESLPYQQICGGSLITTTVVVSAAHCFWTSMLLPPERFAVSLGKVHRYWKSELDVDVQNFNVTNITIPDGFHGTWSNFQNDIALLVLAAPVQYQPHVRPVCLDFNDTFEQSQLAIGQVGKVPGWGLTDEDGMAAPLLKVAELSYIHLNLCYKESPESFHMFITTDKFCAGYLNESSVCQGDSGGGLVFPAMNKRGEQRYYLRGVVSLKAQSNQNHECNVYAHTTFTKISKHQAFIQEHCNYV